MAAGAWLAQGPACAMHAPLCTRAGPNRPAPSCHQAPPTYRFACQQLPATRPQPGDSQHSQCQGRGRGRCAALAGPPGASGPEEGEPVDIDELARRLSLEANRLRLESSSSDDEEPLSALDSAGAAPDDTGQPGSSGAGPDASSPPSLFQEAGVPSIAELVAELGDGGFVSREFELQQQLARLAVQQVTEAPGGLGGFGGGGGSGLPGRVDSAAETAVVLFRARYFSGQPFEDAVTVLLKEFLPGAAMLARNELAVMGRLAGLPRRKWTAAKAPLSPDPPIVQLLGHFVAGQTETARLAGGGAGGETLWLVYKWEGLLPLSVYPSAPQAAPGGGLFWGGSAAKGREAALQARCAMLRAIVRGSLEAVAWVHARGCAHGSLGGGSLLLSTCDDRRAADLIVKLDNLGFANSLAAGSQLGSGTSGELPSDHPLRLAQAADLEALALVLLETIFAALAGQDGSGAAGTQGSGGGDAPPPSPPPSGAALQRLLLDVFKGNVQDFRRYCLHEPDWTEATAFLDVMDSAGWRLVEGLLSGQQTAEQLLTNPLCTL